MRLHRGGRWRSWLGARFGGDAELGNRVWRRFLHLAGALVLVYYLIPPGFFVLVSNATILVLGLAAMLVLELLRWLVHLELPTIRPFESGRVASFAYFSVALVAAVLVFPEAVAVAVVLGTALVDPLIGELRHRPRLARLYPVAPLTAYGALSFLALRGVGGWALGAALLGSGVAAILAVAIERLRVPHLDDDLVMTLVPGVALWALFFAAPSIPLTGGS